MVSKAQILKFATIDYTCGCGLYVHPDNPLTSCKAIHIDDCEFKMNIDRIIGRYNFHRGALNIRNSVKETAKEFNLSSRIVCEALGFTEEFIKDFGDDLPARRAPMNSTLQMYKINDTGWLCVYDLDRDCYVPAIKLSLMQLSDLAETIKSLGY